MAAIDKGCRQTTLCLSAARAHGARRVTRQQTASRRSCATRCCTASPGRCSMHDNASSASSHAGRAGFVHTPTTQGQCAWWWWGGPVGKATKALGVVVVRSVAEGLPSCGGLYRGHQPVATTHACAMQTAFTAARDCMCSHRWLPPCGLYLRTPMDARRLHAGKHCHAAGTATRARLTTHLAWPRRGELPSSVAGAGSLHLIMSVVCASCEEEPSRTLQHASRHEALGRCCCAHARHARASPNHHQQRTCSAPGHIPQSRG